MQALRHSGCWSDNSTPIFLLNNNENYAFIGIKWSFFDVLLPDIESYKKVGKKQVSSIFKIMKIKTKPLCIIQQSTNFCKLWYSLKSSVKAFKPCHCHNKMDIFQRCIQNSVKHFRWQFSQKKITAKKFSVSSLKDPS